MTDAAEAARRLQRYAKQFHAGGFATPTARELATNGWLERDGTILVGRQLDRDSIRRDWTGRSYRLPRGWRIVTHLARDPGTPVPDLFDFDMIYAYREDGDLGAGLEAQRLEVYATHISAASEIKGAWGRQGTLSAEPVDALTATPVPFHLTDTEQAAAAAEVAGLAGWCDDYPYYSDGTWGALNLRGFRPDDPLWGVKPAEMGRKWNDAHPGALSYRCGWTRLADACPTLREVAESVPWWRNLERVRLMRMAGRPGGGRLARHSDVTDRNAGTRDGAICRFHIPIATDPAITMTTWDLDGTATSHHLPPWSCWYLDQRKPHAVTNPTATDRIHLVVDVVADREVRARLLEAA